MKGNVVSNVSPLEAGGYVIEARILAIGTAPAFRQQMVRATDAETAATVEWTPAVAVAKQRLLLPDGPPDVVAISPEIGEADAFALLAFLSQVSPATALVLVRDRIEKTLLWAAMRAGIKDVVDLSKGTEELRQALDGALGRARNLRSTGSRPAVASRRRGRLISVFSSKGGTGKSFLASNLSAALSHRWRKDVALVDLDFEMGDAFAYFRKDPASQVEELLALGERAERDSVRRLGTSFGEHLWGFGAPMDPAAPSMAGEKAGRLLGIMRGTFDYTVVDCPASYADHVLAALDLADWICLVMGLDVAGLRHVAMALDTLIQLGIPREKFRIVLNRADSKVGLSIEAVEKILDLAVDARIPSSRLAPASLNVGVPVCLGQPKSAMALALYDLAAQLTGLPLGEANGKPRRTLWLLGSRTKERADVILP